MFKSWLVQNPFFQTCSNDFRLPKLLQNCPNWSKLFQIDLNLFEMDKTCPNLFKRFICTYTKRKNWKKEYYQRRVWTLTRQHTCNNQPSLYPLSHGSHIWKVSNLELINKICLPCLASKLQKSKENIGKINKITCLKFIRGRRQGKSFNWT